MSKTEEFWIDLDFTGIYNSKLEAQGSCTRPCRIVEYKKYIKAIEALKYIYDIELSCGDVIVYKNDKSLVKETLKELGEL